MRNMNNKTIVVTYPTFLIYECRKDGKYIFITVKCPKFRDKQDLIYLHVTKPSDVLQAVFRPSNTSAQFEFKKFLELEATILQSQTISRTAGFTYFSIVSTSLRWSKLLHLVARTTKRKQKGICGNVNVPFISK